MRRRALSDRERKSLERLVVGHQARLRAFLCRFEPDPDLVDEFLQDVFIGVIPRCEALASWDADKAGSYLRGVARNLVRLRWRRIAQSRARAVRPLLCQALEADLEREPDDSDLRMRWLKDCLDRQSPEACQLVDSHFFHGITLARLAAAARKSSAALRMAMFRVHRRLRDCVDGHLKETTS